MRLSSRAAGLLLALLALTLCGAVRVTAQTPAATAPSAEEALLGLLDYRLQPADLPAGFELVQQEGVSPTGLALDRVTSTTDLLPALRDVQDQGFVVGFRQVIGPNNITPVRIFSFETRLFATNEQASAALNTLLDLQPDPGLEIDNPVLPVRLGQESFAVHATLTQADSNNLALEAISWRRGRLDFITVMEVLDSTETLDQLMPLAISADRRATSVPPPVILAAATLPAAGSEEYRAGALVALYTRLPGANQSPLGFRTVDRTVITNADFVAKAPDPRAAFTRLTTTWKRVIEVERTYNTLQGESGDVIHARYALSADAAGALANVLDPQHEPGSSVEVFSLPAPLGDVSRLYHETYTGTNGVRSEAWRVIWARGRVVLSLFTTGPAGDFTVDDALALAAGLDDRYSRTPLPAVLTDPLPSRPVPVPVPIS
jgi:hypothetical protein